MKKSIRIFTEIFLYHLLVFAADFYLPSSPGFSESYFIPYLWGCLILSSLYGMNTGLLYLLVSTLFIYLIVPLSHSFFHGEFFLSLISDIFLKSRIPLSLALLTVYFLGLIQRHYRYSVERFRERLKVRSSESLNCKRTSRALKTVNREFEERITRQQDSVSALFSQYKKMDSLNTGYILTTMMETIQLFTDVSRASVWRYSRETSFLHLVKTLGNEDREQDRISLEGTIEGFVFRNNQMYSVKMAVEMKELHKMHSYENIMTIPVLHGRERWGILNIEEMPFEKFSSYSEKLIQLIISLASASLEKALNYESLVNKTNVDRTTGLPLYGQFYQVLEEELKSARRDNSSVSVILFELVNYEELKKAGDSEVKKLFYQILEGVLSETGHEFYYFCYKEINQLAVIASTLDFDGVSYYALNCIKAFSQGDWELYGRPVNMEVVLGYATRRDENTCAEDLIREAETLLDMSRQ